MPLSKQEFKKYADPDFSLLEQEYRNMQAKWMFWIITLSICFFLSGLALLVPYIMAKRSYEYVTMLKQRERVDKLLELVRYQTGDYNSRFAIFTLVDMQVKDVAFVLDDLLEESNTYMVLNTRKNYQLALDVLAAKLDYRSVAEMLKLLERPTAYSRIVPSIPITSVYYLDEAPMKAKCIISSLILDFDEDTIVACPNCGGLARKELMIEWLEENGKCKSCHRIIAMADCPTVVVRK